MTINKLSGAKLKPSLIILFLFILLWLCPTPNGLTDKGWHLFVIFFLTILSLILKPLPMGGVAMTSVCVVVITKTLTLKVALSSFSSSIVWLIVSAFLLAKGFIKTGLGDRISYYLISLLGKTTLGLAYGLTMAELIFAPLMPSNTARGAGIIYPVINSLNNEYNSRPKDSSRKIIGSYLIKLMYQINVLTSAMFLTATAGNPLIVGIVRSHGVELSWRIWATACIVPGIVSLIILPVIMYIIYPPLTKLTPNAPKFAKEKILKLGKLTLAEKIMLMVFFLLLSLWVFGDFFKIDATTASIFGLVVLLFSGVLNWNDVITEKGAWNTFVWMAVLIMLSEQLSSLGITSFFGNKIQDIVKNFSTVFVFLVVTLGYFYSHYLFASMTAHISAMYSTLFIVAVNANAPVMYTALFMATGSSLSAGLTHYGTGTAPVYFGTDYVTISEWWRIGFIISIVNLVVFGVIGGVWWKILGYW